MNFDILAALKKKFRTLEEHCRAFDKKELTGLADECNSTLEEIFNLDITTYLLYLTASDSYISGQEIEMFTYITELEVDDADAMRDTIENTNVYSEEFETTVPWIIKIMTRCENALNSINEYSQYSVVEEFVEFFKLLGLTYINVDGEMCEAEKTDYLSYIARIEDYVEDNLIYK
mgnify:CR=1 FL=1